MRRRRGTHLGVSWSNCVLLFATGLLVVLISVHAKNPRPHRGLPTSASSSPSVDQVATGNGHRQEHSADGAVLQRLSDPDPNPDPEKDIDEDEGLKHHHHHLHHRQEFDAYLGTIRRLRRPYRSKYTIEQLMRLHVTPKVSETLTWIPARPVSTGLGLGRGMVTGMGAHIPHPTGHGNGFAFALPPCRFNSAVSQSLSPESIYLHTTYNTTLQEFLYKLKTRNPKPVLYQNTIKVIA